MKNIAKCKLCNEIIESMHSTDFVECKCGQISVYGGSSLKCGAKDWKNFFRLDDDGNEISVTQEEDNDLSSNRLTKFELMDQLKRFIESIERLPPHAMSAPTTHYDLYSLAALVLSIFKSDCIEDI